METIQRFEPQTHRSQVVELWQRVLGYNAAHNAPNLTIDKKLAPTEPEFNHGWDRRDTDK
jgi:hypothetical protein